ncbi:MAG: hypothetical protein ACFCVK_22970 [Acidimicrobiales bacterium]
MTHPTRVNPILYNRLQYALADIIGGVDAEVEFVAQHLDLARSEFAERWDQLDGASDDPRKRYLDGTFRSINAFYVIEARMNNDNVIELRNIRVVLDPTITSP